MSNNNLITTNVYHFLNGHFGGVYQVVRNLIVYSRNPAVKNHVIYVIEKERFPDWKNSSIASDCTEYIFRYSRYENIYHVYRRLAKSIPKEAVLVAHDWFELGMVSAIGMCNRVIYMLHGNYDYYISLLETHKNEIDTVLCVSHSTFDQVSGFRFNAEQVFHFRFPAPAIPYSPKDFSVIRIAVIAENLFDPNKGVSLIREINRVLIQKAIPVEWHLAGNGFTNESLESWWGNMKNLPVYYGFLSRNHINHFFESTNVYILPSLNEGVPVSLVEAMKAGLVPVIANWSDNVNQFVIDGKSGLVLHDNSVESYVNALSSIFESDIQSRKISKNASEIAHHQFDSFRQVLEFEGYLMQEYNRRLRKKKKIYGSRLDNKIIPNIITVILRKLKSLWALHYFL